METHTLNNSMVGKICLVTGATSGIGKVTAIALAAQGANVIITGRNLQKTREAAHQIKLETGSESVDYLLADFSDLGQVRKLATEFKERYSRLDVLLNNAGAFFNGHHRTSYGVEETFLVNHLAPFLLTNLLIETLKNSAPARVILVSSDAHKLATLDFDDLEFNHGFFGIKAYGRSKLANLLFTFELARRLEGTGVSVNAVHPGHVATDIWKTNFSIFGPLLKYITSLIALTPQQGADTLIYLASSPEVAKITGQYFIKRESVPSSPLSLDEETADKLWTVSEKITS
ncbi:MAG: SDR family oxidoreductase [Chloroflexi bacterium]|nr:SDR family oxidoreductase [Chloroflexota bacterium]